jgi:hypothetical protein
MKKSKIQEAIDNSIGITDPVTTNANKNIQDIINKNTGAPSHKPEKLGLDNAIWDDGEWISWDEINSHLNKK